jgi:TAT (twin-arginine translocation) pathway signal sequence
MAPSKRKGVFTRRTFIKSSAAAGATLASPLLAPAVHAQAKPIKLGYVSPQTGPSPPSPRRTISSSAVFATP